jgi:dUTP pyrophosphatase
MSAQLTVPLRVLPHGQGLQLPTHQTAGSAGADLRAALEEPITVLPGQRVLVPCGFQMALPEGWEVQVRPRSGLAIKHGITVLNAPGTIDADYRGEVRVALVNLGQEPFEIARGDRIAQMVLAPVTQVSWDVVNTLDATERGDGGFGSTGS